MVRFLRCRTPSPERTCVDVFPPAGLRHRQANARRPREVLFPYGCTQSGLLALFHRPFRLLQTGGNCPDPHKGWRNATWLPLTRDLIRGKRSIGDGCARGRIVSSSRSVVASSSPAGSNWAGRRAPRLAVIWTGESEVRR